MMTLEVPRGRASPGHVTPIFPFRPRLNRRSQTRPSPLCSRSTVVACLHVQIYVPDDCCSVVQTSPAQRFISCSGGKSDRLLDISSIYDLTQADPRTASIFEVPECQFIHVAEGLSSVPIWVCLSSRFRLAAVRVLNGVAQLARIDHGSGMRLEVFESFGVCFCAPSAINSRQSDACGPSGGCVCPIDRRPTTTELPESRLLLLPY